MRISNPKPAGSSCSLGAMAVAVGLFSSLAIGPAGAQTRDRTPPSREKVCSHLRGAAFGLCNAFCEAQDCDVYPKKSCAQLRRNFARKTGSSVFPCEVTPSPSRTRTQTPTRTLPPPTTPPTRTFTPTPTRTPTPTPRATGTASTECRGPGTDAAFPWPAGSIVVWPRVIADIQGLTTAVDTIITLTNTSNLQTRVHCIYVNAAPADPTQPPGPNNPPLWQSINFDLVLTHQQPTHWSVASGRVVDPNDPLGTYGAGFDPGAIPPVDLPFTGELKCFQVDESFCPFGGNSLTGEATTIGPILGSGTLPNPDVTRYNATTIKAGADFPDCDQFLRLDGIEYQACPAELRFNHLSDFATSPAGGTVVTNRLTLVPCHEDFETQTPTRARVEARVYDEFELPFSAAFTVDCWLDQQLADISNIFTAVLGTTFRQTRLVPLRQCLSGPVNGAACGDAADCLGFPCAPAALLGVLEETHRDPVLGGTGRATRDLQACGSAPGSVITVVPQLPQP